MSDSIDTGGSAYPGLSSTDDFGCSRPSIMSDGSAVWEIHEQGMTLRDHFAGLALSGLVFHNDFGSVSDEGIAKGAYAYADAMIAARKEQA